MKELIRRGIGFCKKVQLYFKLLRKKQIKVVLGAGGISYKGWISTDFRTVNIPVEKTWRRFFNENAIDAILAEHVWEHLTEEESVEGAKIAYKYLKKGGYFRIAVPDGFHPDPEYISLVNVTVQEGAADPMDFHHVLYNYKTLSGIFKRVGFRVRLLEHYDEKGTFHFNEWSPDEGIIYRSSRFKFLRSDVSILKMPGFTSLIIDAVKD